jgi:hypothetical protein
VAPRHHGPVNGRARSPTTRSGHRKRRSLRFGVLPPVEMASAGLPRGLPLTTAPRPLRRPPRPSPRAAFPGPSDDFDGSKPPDGRSLSGFPSRETRPPARRARSPHGRRLPRAGEPTSSRCNATESAEHRHPCMDVGVLALEAAFPRRTTPRGPTKNPLPGSGQRHEAAAPSCPRRASGYSGRA